MNLTLNSKQYFHTLDFLRGLAALMVVLFHYSNGMLPTISDQQVSEVLSYGKYGVQIFFVISGFIIPYSMENRNYTQKNFFRNLLRRFLRIDPPSYVAMMLSISLYYTVVAIAGRGINGIEWPGLSLLSVFANLTYTVPFLDTDWFNPVFWTLAIELQFYIIIGVVLPLFKAKKHLSNLTILCVMLALGFVRYHWFFQYSSFFVLGLLVFLVKKKELNLYYFLVFLLLTFFSCYLQRGFSEFAFGLVTFIAIACNWSINTKISTFLGMISYSLYIIHPICGPAIEMVAKRLVDLTIFIENKSLFLVLYTVLAILCAWVFYLIVEKPFLNFSKKINY